MIIFILGYFTFNTSTSEFLDIIKPKSITSEITTDYNQFIISGTVITGNNQTTQIGFPTANLKIDDNVQLPSNFSSGIYLARCRLSSHEIELYKSNKPNWSNYKEKNKTYLVYFHLSPKRDICYCYFPDIPTKTNLINKYITLEDITRLDSHLIDFIQTYHNYLDKTKINNYVKKYY
jgi:hypothetical protein